LKINIFAKEINRMESHFNRAFDSFIDFPVRRLEKPRNTGLTWFLDWGSGLTFLDEMLTAVGDHLDLAKLPALSAALQPKDYLKKKVEMYKKHNIKAFMGGMFLEAALISRQHETFVKKAADLGFEVIEVSESESRMVPSTKLALIESIANMNFQVMAELGPHYAEAPYDPREVILTAKQYMNAGAWKIILESDVIEFMEPWSNSQNAGILKHIIDEIGYENIIFEISDKVRTCQWFVLNYGPDVNLALNKGPIAQLAEGVMTIEHIRRGLLMPDTWFGRIASI
jgi:phosphosulfolactate synthase